MAAPTYAQYNDKRYGVTVTGNKDKFNEACRDLWTRFKLEHDRDGVHKSDLDDNLWKQENISWSGNSTANRDITLSDGTLDIKFIRILSDNQAYTFFRSEDMTGDNTAQSYPAVFASNKIRSVGTGTFQVGDNAAVNASGTTYHAIIYGV